MSSRIDEHFAMIGSLGQQNMPINILLFENAKTRLHQMTWYQS